MNRYFILIPFLFFQFCSSYTGAYKSQIGDLCKCCSLDTIVKDLPLNKNGNPLSFYKNKEGIENKLGLKTLENGYDSLQMRLWYYYTVTDTSQLIIFKKTDDVWTGEIIYFIENFYQKNDSANIKKNVIENVKPKTGWNKFSKKLSTLQIYTLPDDTKIPNYPRISDGEGIIIEIGTTKKYRIYHYNVPRIAQDSIWQAKKIEKILELISYELNFKQLSSF